MICKRCGMQMKVINYRHINFCNRLPVPHELAQQYLESGLSYGEMATHYETSPDSLRRRILFGLKQLNAKARPRGPRVEAGDDGTVPDVDSVHCSVCTIIITTPEEHERGVCNYCAGNSFDYIKFRSAEPLARQSVPATAVCGVAY